MNTKTTKTNIEYLDHPVLRGTHPTKPAFVMGFDEEPMKLDTAIGVADALIQLGVATKVIITSNDSYKPLATVTLNDDEPDDEPIDDEYDDEDEDDWLDDEDERIADEW